MSDFIGIVIIIAMVIFFTIAMQLAGVEKELRDCAQEHNVFKCEQVITYVPVITGEDNG